MQFNFLQHGCGCKNYLDKRESFAGNFTLDIIPFIEVILSGNSKTT